MKFRRGILSLVFVLCAVAVTVSLNRGKPALAGTQPELASTQPEAASVAPEETDLRKPYFDSDAPGRFPVTIESPQAGSAKRTYFIKGHSLCCLENGTEREVQLNGGVTREEHLSWPTGLTTDDSGNNLIVSTLGGEGYLLKVSLPEEKWSVIQSLENLDLTALCFNPLDKRYYALMEDYQGDGNELSKLVIFNENFGQPEIHPLSEAIPASVHTDAHDVLPMQEGFRLETRVDSATYQYRISRDGYVGSQGKIEK